MGREFVRQLGAEGTMEEIWVIARRKERLEELRQESRTPLRVFPLDLTQPQSLEQDALSMIDLNVRALAAVTMACIPYMLSGGHIIEIASTAAFQPLPDMNVYAASKAFVLSYSRALNRELGRKGVTVTAVCPGWTKTEFFDVAKKDASSGAVRNFFFPSRPDHVVAKALKDARRGRDVSVYGIFNKLHLVFAKILPASSVMTLWGAMK